MRTLLILVALLAAPLSLADDITIDLAKAAPGTRIDLDGRWPYKPGYSVGVNEKPETATTDDGYNPVPVPQILSRIRWWLDDSKDFEAFEETRLKSLGFDTDKAEDGWYRKTIDIPTLPAGKKLFIEFDGVAMRSKAFCNGQLLGEHAGMFSRFNYDLTPHLKPGKNVLAIYVSMEKNAAGNVPMGNAVTVNLTASKVLTMSKGMFGPLSPGSPNRDYDLHGIWQPVRLVVHGDAQIDDAWFIPTLTGAEVKVETQGSGSANLTATWTDKMNGEKFASAGPVKVTLGKEQSIKLANVQPKLWTPADPNLYKLEVTLAAENGTPLDAWTHDVGFRTFEVKGSQLYLNGHPYWLRGANQLPYGKNPTDPTLAKKLIQFLHDNNIRITRTHATPWNEPWLDAADEIGLGVSIEGIRPWALVGKIGPCPPDMFKIWLDENADVVKRCRNHPSVLIWTVGNEMMLRDTENPEKWKQLSDVVKQTRTMDPYRPVVCSSTYAREAKIYDKLLMPNNFDDGDLDDVHYYRGWYSMSPFVTDSLFEKEFKARGSDAPRPLIGQEMSAGYPDLDTGLPVFRYTRDLVTPQAWVGNNAYPGSDPAIFLEHERTVNKRWAEQLRFQRGDRTSGFLLFSTECWFQHSYDPSKATPYAVVEGVKQAFMPVGLALETSRRRFYAGEKLTTSIFLTNDDESFHDLDNVEVHIHVADATSHADLLEQKVATVSIPYYATQKLPLEISFPSRDVDRQKLDLVLSVTKDGKELSRTIDPIEVFKQPQAVAARAIGLQNLGPEMSLHLKGSPPAGATSVALLGPTADLAAAKAMAESGSTVILLSPGKALVTQFPQDILEYKTETGEYADWSPIAGTPLTSNLEPMDLKWWGRKDDWRVFVTGGTHRLKPDGKARELIRFIPAHSYIAADKVPLQYRTAMFEIPVGKGRIWVCDLDLEASVNVDPAAALFAENMLKAAADPHSTEKLPTMPTHEEMLKRK